MKTKTIKIKGIHCAMCIRKIINSFESIENFKIKVDPKSGKAKITFDENIITLNEITEEIKNLGYEPIL